MKKEHPCTRRPRRSAAVYHRGAGDCRLERGERIDDVRRVAWFPDPERLARTWRKRPSPAVASAGTYKVNTTADLEPTGSACGSRIADCSLRQAIAKADSTTAADTIILPAGRYKLTANGRKAALFVATERSRSRGRAREQTIINASGIQGPSWTVEAAASLSVSRESRSTGGRTTGNGGGIEVDNGNLRLTAVAVTSNVSSEGGRGGHRSLRIQCRIVDSTIRATTTAETAGGSTHTQLT